MAKHMVGDTVFHKHKFMLNFCFLKDIVLQYIYTLIHLKWTKLLVILSALRSINGIRLFV